MKRSSEGIVTRDQSQMLALQYGNDRKLKSPTVDCVAGRIRFILKRGTNKAERSD